MKVLVNDFAGHPFQLQLSRALAETGDQVRHTYFGANNTPKGRVSGGDRHLEVIDVTIDRQFKKHSLLTRRSADIAYGKALGQIIREFQPDVVLSANTPIDAQRLALAATREVQGKFVFWLQDLLSVGIEFVLRKKRVPLARLGGYYYRGMERALLEKSDAIVCIAPEFRTLLERWKINPAKTFVIENWATLDEVRPMPKDNAWAREQGIENKFCFMYSGTLGMKHKPQLLLELAQRVEQYPDVVVVVIAEGHGAEWLRTNANKVKQGVLRTLSFQSYERLSEVFSAADVLIALLDEDCGAFAVPSKTLTYLCVGRPVLIAAQLGNLAAQIVARSGAGLAVLPRTREFLEAAETLYQDAEVRRTAGTCARNYAVKTFDIQHITSNFQALFGSVVNKKS